MTASEKFLQCVSSAAVMLVFMAGAALAQTLELLSAEERANWQMVGRVNGAGFSARTGCTGTLIAPDLVVTAAHCTRSVRGARPKLHFVAGWYRGRFKAHRVVRTVVRHPLYGQLTGLHNYSRDIAVLVLKEPVPIGLLAPLPLASRGAWVTSDAILLGYENARPHALSGRHDCPLRGQSQSMRLYGCEVRSGASGGAVVTREDGVEKLSGVIVARRGQQGHALIAPIGDWLRDQWSEALVREKRRRGS